MDQPLTPSSLTGLPTREDVEFYREQGYLKFGRIFTEDELSDLSAYLDRLIEELPAGKRPEHLDVPHFEHPYLFRFLTHPGVLDVIETFIGPNITLWSSHFISKPGGDGLAAPWHTDADYWGARLEPMEVVTLWLAVDPSSPENGCMRVIPGSHKSRNHRYHDVDQTTNVFDAEIDAEEIDESQAVDLTVDRGECHFHHAWTVHGSRPNLSNSRRCGYTMRYMPSFVEVRNLEPRHSSHRVYLVRGEDLTGGRTEYSGIPRWEEG